jgi:catechol 2,3-dioxygenase-like lactoylglutathione lyase family enzyme
MIKLQRLGHILISVRDLERSKDFYTRILDFKVLEQDPEHGGLFLSIGGLGNTLDLFQCTNPNAVASSDADLGGRNGLGLGHMAFAVDSEDDLKDAYFALQSAGIAILRAIDHVSQKSIDTSTIPTRTYSRSSGNGPMPWKYSPRVAATRTSL